MGHQNAGVFRRIFQWIVKIMKAPLSDICKLRRRLRLKDTTVYRRKDESVLCPCCSSKGKTTKMRYRRVSGTMRHWSPFDYAWQCDVCVHVWVLDGAMRSQDKLWKFSSFQRKANSMLKCIQEFAFSNDNAFCRPEPD